jgi:HPt (histidine-containing phosphotransfer) domain-containing protein
VNDTPFFIDPAAIARLERIGGVKLARDLIAMYVELGPQRISAFRSAVQAGDAAAVERATHTLKSTAGNLGAVQLQQTAQQMETMAAEGSIDNEVARKLEAQYEQTVTALQKILGELEP